MIRAEVAKPPSPRREPTSAPHDGRHGLALPPARPAFHQPGDRLGRPAVAVVSRRRRGDLLENGLATHSQRGRFAGRPSTERGVGWAAGRREPSVEGDRLGERLVGRGGLAERLEREGLANERVGLVARDGRSAAIGIETCAEPGGITGGGGKMPVTRGDEIGGPPPRGGGAHPSGGRARGDAGRVELLTTAVVLTPRGAVAPYQPPQPPPYHGP